jgi:spore coat polysaccharide biosynthesis protein SpsF (cytidylyltransferase family)
MHATAIVIPVRLNSTRLPQKLLRDIAGRTLFSRSLTIAQQIAKELPADLYVGTRDQPLIDIAHTQAHALILPRPDLESGDESPRRFASWVEHLSRHTCILHLNACFPFLDPHQAIAAVHNFSGLPRLPVTVETTPIWRRRQALIAIAAPGTTDQYHRFTHQWHIATPATYTDLRRSIWRMTDVTQYDVQQPGPHTLDINTHEDLELARAWAEHPTRQLDSFCP